MHRCGQVFKRHSKSVDIANARCSSCHSAVHFLGKFAADGSQVKARGATPYSSFVQQHYAAVKAAQPSNTPHREVMRQLSKRWQDVKSGEGASMQGLELGSAT